MSEPNCKGCKFWRPCSGVSEESGSESGLCKRHPPRWAVPDDEHMHEGPAGMPTLHGCNWSYPVTDAEEWCGEWAAVERPA